MAMRWLFTLALLFLAGSVKAQVIELQGGVSNSLGEGGGFTFYSPNLESRFTAGVSRGRFTYAASEHTEYRKWDLVLGDNMFALSSGQLALSAPVRGLSAYRKFKKSAMFVFTGAVGDVFSSPYFFGIQHAKIGAGIGYQREVAKGLIFGTIQEADVHRKTSLGDIQYKPSCSIGAPQPPLAGAGAFRNCWWSHLTFRAQAGLLQSNPQVGGDAALTTKHLSLNAGRHTYIFNVTPNPGTPLLAARTTTNSYSAFTNIKFLNLNASRFESNLNRGTSAGVGAQLGWLSTQFAEYRGGKTKNHVLVATERGGLHWSFSEYVTHSNGSWQYNGGLSYSGNRLNFSVGESVLYFPVLRNPWQKVLSISIGLRIKSASVNASTVVQPTGKNQWMIGGQDYANTGLRLPTVSDGSESAMRNLPQYGHGGRFVVAGFVLDDKGAPVEGACVQVNGSDPVFTDSTGHFSVQEKHKDVSIHVETENFMQGNWQVVEAPKIAHAGEPVHIVVKRK